ncbi:MAG: hypothetical protein ACRDJ4_02595, partial [Actinomycetota bacterium]
MGGVFQLVEVAQGLLSVNWPWRSVLEMMDGLTIRVPSIPRPNTHREEERMELAAVPTEEG